MGPRLNDNFQIGANGATGGATDFDYFIKPSENTGGFESLRRYFKPRKTQRFTGFLFF